jgi:hypothetical protein
VKRQAAERWVAAVNADRRYGRWHYLLIEKIAELPTKLAAMRNVDTHQNSVMPQST